MRLSFPIVMLALSVALPVAGCRLFSTELERIASDPFRFHGQDVTVQGRVEAVRWIPEVGAMGFRLVDGSDSLLVLTQGPTPAESERVRIAGRVHRSFPVAGTDRVVLLSVSHPERGGGDVR